MTNTQILKAVNAWTEQNSVLAQGAHVYDARQWRERGERMGNGSGATMVIEESPLHEIINYPYYPHQYEISEQFQKHFNDLGIRVESGYSWTLHFYGD